MPYERKHSHDYTWAITQNNHVLKNQKKWAHMYKYPKSVKFLEKIKYIDFSESKRCAT